MSKAKYMIPIAIIALLLGLTAYLFSKGQAEQVSNSELRASTIFPEPKALPSFKLINQKGEIFNNSELQHHWTLLFFGFTNCPDVCPTTLAQLKNFVKQLPANYISDPLQVVLVTIDPSRDNAQQLQQYLTQFGPNFIGLTGKQQALLALQKFFGVATADDNQTVRHTASVFLINPEGKWLGLFSPPLSTNVMMSDFLKIAHKANNEPSKRIYDIHHNIVDLSNTHKWLVINYWASWCKPCYLEIPELNKLYEHHKNELLVVGVNYDGMSLGEQQKFAEKYNISYPLLANDLGRAYNVNEIEHLPATIIINPEGKVVTTLFGAQTVQDLKQTMNLT